ncbi:hypothetical protein VTI28DRAFT_2020 [Corynascus sepedonium]
MHPRRTYFLAPTRDQPPTGAIALGNLIVSPREPDFPLNDPNSPTAERLRATATVIPELDATRSTASKLSLRPTVFLTFLWGLLGGQNPVELGFELSREHAASYRIPRLETRTIHPSMTEVAALFAEDRVQNALRDSRFEASLYLVTGVQIATHGAEYVVRAARERGVHLHLIADLPVAAAAAAVGAAPVGAGAGVEVSTDDSGRSTGRIENAFVLAYSLREVLYRRKKITGQRRPRVQGDLYAVHGQGPKGNKVAEEEVVEFEAELAGLKEEDPELPEYWDLPAEIGNGPDGKDCQIVRIDIKENDNYSNHDDSDQD